jgi:hypothetical protein
MPMTDDEPQLTTGLQDNNVEDSFHGVVCQSMNYASTSAPTASYAFAHDMLQIDDWCLHATICASSLWLGHSLTYYRCSAEDQVWSWYVFSACVCCRLSCRVLDHCEFAGPPNIFYESYARSLPLKPHFVTEFMPR